MLTWLGVGSIVSVHAQVKSHQKISNSEGGFTGTLDDRDWYGQSVAALGDLDRDGTTDLAVGASHDDDGGTDANADRGAVWILFLDQPNTNVAIESIDRELPEHFGLSQNYPNLSISATTIRYELPEAMRVQLTI